MTTPRPNDITDLVSRLRKKQQELGVDARTFLDGAHWRKLYEDLENRPERDRFVHWPWTDLDEVYGPMLPGSIHILAARTGGGKTTMMANLVRLWTMRANPLPVVYFPTETPALDIHIQLACLDLGVDPVRIRYHDYAALGGDDADGQAWGRWLFESYLGEQVRWLSRSRHPDGDGPPAPLLSIIETPRPRLGELVRQVKAYADDGAKVIIIDHLLRLDGDEDASFFDRVSKAVVTLSKLAQECQLVILLTSQLGRDGSNRMSAFTVPVLASLKGSGAIEEEAHGVLFLNAVRRLDATKAEIEAVREGFADMHSIRDPHLTLLTIAKHRVNGKRAGSKVYLWHERGALTDLGPHEKMAMNARMDGIR
ncbi:MAG: AAA family ATPase [Burkholderiales bacterium]|nr:AAA family ATPase [Burkholderiales bacterium]